MSKSNVAVFLKIELTALRAELPYTGWICCQCLVNLGILVSVLLCSSCDVAVAWGSGFQGVLRSQAGSSGPQEIHLLNDWWWPSQLCGTGMGVMEKRLRDKDRQWVGLEWRGEGGPCAIYGVILPCYGHWTMIMHIGQRILDYCYILLQGLFGPLI